MLLRKLPPWHSNLGKRLVKSPKVYVRDSGLLHALLGLTSREAQCDFYRSSNGAEIDLAIDVPGLGLMAIEVKKSFNAKPRRGFYCACEDLQPIHKFLVHGRANGAVYPVGDGVMAVGLKNLAQRLAQRP